MERQITEIKHLHITMGRVDLGELGSEGGQGTLCEILKKNQEKYYVRKKIIFLEFKKK